MGLKYLLNLVYHIKLVFMFLALYGRKLCINIQYVFFFFLFFLKEKKQEKELLPIHFQVYHTNLGCLESIPPELNFPCGKRLPTK